MASQALRLAYLLRRHACGPWRLDAWVILLAAGLPAALVLRWALRGRPPLPAWHWPTLALLFAAAGGLAWLARWARSRDYVVFEPQHGLALPTGLPLPPPEKIPLLASGRFQVQQKSGLFVALPAFWRSFETREHTVMACVNPSRFLLLGAMPEEDLGMWYVFLTPDAIERVDPGRLAHGAAGIAALRVAYRSTPPARAGRRSPPAPNRDVIYLAFEDEDARRRVWADLLADV